MVGTRTGNVHILCYYSYVILVWLVMEGDQSQQRV